MSQGYPSRKRVRKAFERGVKTARTRRGFNPYKNAILKDLYERGKNRAPNLSDGAQRTGEAAQPLRNRPSQPLRNSASQPLRNNPGNSLRNNPFDPPRRFGDRRQG